MSYINGNRIIKVYIPTYLDLDTVYPVGSVYISVNSTSPASLFGGTWELINSKFLLGTDDLGNLGDTGGNATHNHTAGTLVSNLDFLNGKIYANKVSSSWNNNIETNGLGITESSTSYSMENGLSVSGSTDSSNNMPPYIKVAIWKRTA